jgi:hypothetical protein
MNELMDRLARANPTPTDEPLTADEQREADALLQRILADPEPLSAPKRSPLVRRIVPAAGLLALLALAAVIVIDLVDSEQRADGIVERAVAAVSHDDVIYATSERWTLNSVALDPGIEMSPDERAFVRSWAWREGNRSHHLRYRLLPGGSPGRLHSEVVSTPERITWFDADGKKQLSSDKDPDAPAAGDEGSFPGFDPFSDPGAQLREHVESGKLRVAGSTTVRGRTAYRLVSEPDKIGREYGTVTYLVDASTYLPLEVRQRVAFDDSDVPGGGRERATIRIEYLRYEALPVTDETKRLLEKGGGLRP